MLTLWAFQGQALRDGKLASCQQAVSDIIAHQALVGGPVPTADTGDYCKARASLPVDALKELACETAARAEFEADAEWFWKGRHAKLVDGPTFTMPDTAENQAAYPQQKGQGQGLGFPIARVCTILSLTPGRYQGK